MATRTAHKAISPEEAADRLALRELFDAYAHCADRRDAAGQQSLFTPDTVFSVFMSGPGTAASYVIRSCDGLRARVCRFEQVRGDDTLQRPADCRLFR